MWACPHCGAPQAEAARCWVCHRSSTTCSTCRHFRPSLAADVGYCGKDRWRTPLTGLELRACWEEGRRSVAPFGSIAPSAGAQPPVAGPALHVALEPGDRSTNPSAAVVRGDGGPLDRPNPMRLRGFVPLDEVVLASTQAEPPRRRPLRKVAPATPPAETPPAATPPAATPPAALVELPDRWEARTSLFGDADR